MPLTVRVHWFTHALHRETSVSGFQTTVSGEFPKLYNTLKPWPLIVNRDIARFELRNTITLDVCYGDPIVHVASS